MAAWDLFLDPQMVDAGRWAWAAPLPGLPGVPGVPLTNAAGWLATGIVIVAALDRLLPASGATDPGAGTVRTETVRTEMVPAALLAWTWLGSTLANLTFFDRPVLAVYGGVLLGATVLPYLSRLAAPAPGALTGANPAVAGRCAA